MRLRIKQFVILYSLLFFSILLHADGEDIQIRVNNAASVHEDSGTMDFTIQLSEKPDWGEELVINYTTRDGSATAGNDYIARSGTVTFRGPFAGFTWGEDEKTISIDILDDNIYEGTENLYLEISNAPTGYVIVDSTGVGDIYDNESRPLELVLHNKSFHETDGDWTVNFTARLNQQAPSDIIVNYTTIDTESGAVAGSDYVSTSGSITISQNSYEGYIPVVIKGDTLPEDSESFKIKITSISQGTITRDEAIGTIYDDDRIKIDISSSDINEGDSGDTNYMPFRIYLAKPYPLSEPFVVNYSTYDGSNPSATLSDSDYINTTGSVTFNQNETEKIINVPIVGDDEIEPDENLGMHITSSSTIRHTFLDSDSESEIINDDGNYPGISFDTTNFSIIEGNTSQRQLNFNFTLDAPAIAGSSFDYYTQDDEATVADNDYEAISIKTYNIPEGARNITIPVTIYGDTNIENDETFYLKIQNEKHLRVYGHTAKGTIINDDGRFPEIRFEQNSYQVVEGSLDSNQTTTICHIKLMLDQPALANSSFEYYTVDGTAKSAEGDYEAISPTKQFLIPEGEREVTIPITINRDDTIEPDENFKLYIVNPANLTIGGSNSATVIIINDDGEYPKVSIEAPILSGTEGDEGSKNVQFTIKLDAPATEDGVSVEYQTYDGSAKTADSDYEKITPKTVLFNAGESSKTLYAQINGDTKIEEDETFTIALSNPHHANLSESNNSIEITIINDDEHSDEAFECNSNMYISSSTNRATGDRGKMWLHRIDTTKNPFNFELVDDEGASELYNATAYNPDDNYIYGLYYKELIRLSKTGKVINLGEVTALPERFLNEQFYAGAIYGGEYYITGRRSKQDKIYKIKLDDRSVSTITLTQKVAIQDFSFSPDGQYLYGVDREGKFAKINVSNGYVELIGNDHLGYEFDSTFSDVNGRFFANDSNGRGFFEFDTSTGDKQFISNSQPATYNDGANCLQAALVFTDYGDAPISYGPSWHNIANGLYLGEKIDHDLSPYDTIEANGDDLNGVNDDDGVKLADGGDINGTYFKPNATHNLKVTLSKEGYLKIWIDIDINGHFSNNVELVYNSGVALSAGTHIISFTLPDGIQINKTTYLRARVSSTPNLNPAGFATDGEVEDYAIQFGTPINGVRGVFNVQRTDSVVDALDFALYTQIVGRDFDYHVVFYNEELTQEQKLANVPVMVELLDEDSGEVLYRHYSYFSHNNVQSRIPVEINDDLDKIPATKKARFRVTYAANADDSAIQQECSSGDFEECFKTAVASSDKTNSHLSQDNFAIRPDSFYVKILDGTREVVTSQNTPASVNLSAGYRYNIRATATKYLTADPATGYTKTLNKKYDLNTTGTCADTEPLEHSFTFVDGDYNSTSILHDNVGRYILNLNDSNWTKVDQNSSNLGCIEGSGTRVANADGKVGCDIALYLNNIEMIFQPHHFAVNFNMQNLPNSGHPDFIYMMELNATNNNVAIAFDGNITAQAEDNQTTSNFTAGCAATNLLLDLNATTISIEGTNQPILTIDNTPVNFSRVIRFNNETNSSNFDVNRTLISIDREITIGSNRFLEGDNNGSMSLDIRYNLNKNLMQPINPVEVTFHSIEVNATAASSYAHKIEKHTPSGSANFTTDNKKNFYFARVVSDLNNYPRVNMNISPLVRTPLNVDIYCGTTIPNYCRDRKVLSNTNLTGTVREQNGWYLSNRHNGNLDGNVTKLEATPNIVTISPNPSNNIPLNGGANGLVTATFDNCSSPSSTITITTDPVLAFEPSEYTVNCTDVNASQWTGIGKTGNVLTIKPKVNQSEKMDW